MRFWLNSVCHDMFKISAVAHYHQYQALIFLWTLVKSIPCNIYHWRIQEGHQRRSLPLSPISLVTARKSCGKVMFSQVRLFILLCMPTCIPGHKTTSREGGRPRKSPTPPLRSHLHPSEVTYTPGVTYTPPRSHLHISWKSPTPPLPPEVAYSPRSHLHPQDGHGAGGMQPAGMHTCFHGVFGKTLAT